jgi:hypothetical protein
MSLSAFSNTDYLRRSGNNPFNANVVGVGFCCWAKLNGTPGTYSSLSSIDDGGAGTVWHQIATNGASTQMIWSCANGNTILFNPGTNWAFYAFNRAGSNQTTIFWRTASATSLSSTTVTDNDNAATNPPFNWSIGNSGFSEFWNGQITGVKIFGPGALPDAAQYYQESLRLKPSFQGSTLNSWFPSLNAGEAGINFQGDAAQNFTVLSPPLATSLNMPPALYA